MNKVFSDFNIKKATMKLKWWERILLFFRPTVIGYDPGYGDDKSVMIFAKKLFGKIYIVDEKIV